MNLLSIRNVFAPRRVRVEPQTHCVLIATTAQWITATGTVGAAIGTVGALLFSAKAAKSAGASARIANETLKSEARPLLLDVPYEHYTDYEHEYPWPGESMRKTPMRGQIGVDPIYGTFAIPVRNVGRGAASVQSVSFTLSEVGVTHTHPSGIAIPVGEDAWLAGKPEGQDFADALRAGLSPTHGPMPYVFTIAYTDIVGRQRQRLRLAVGTVGQDSALRVKRIEHDVL